MIDCVGMDGKMSVMEKMETALKLEKGRHAYTIFDNKEDSCIKVILKP